MPQIESYSHKPYHT